MVCPIYPLHGHEVSCRAGLKEISLSNEFAPKMVPLYICKSSYNFNEKLYFVILHYSVAFVN